jgi:hypothetical protein
MRLVPAVCALAALAFAQTAAAQVSLAPVSFSPEFQVLVDEELGAREGEYLRGRVIDAVTSALARRGASVSSGAPVVIEISIVDADPNRPTMLQTNNAIGEGHPGSRQTGFFPNSFSIGGAELHATLRGADGQVLTEVTHRRYNNQINDLQRTPTTWTEAQRAILQFATKVADAYVATAR